ncbi:MAG: aldo/keto reductase [Rhodoglobus sp.]
MTGLYNEIPSTNLRVHPLCLGGNVWGWTADAETSFAVLDAYFEGGGNFLDTADGYSRWVPGHSGGESEAIIGDWLSSRGVRDKVVVATKVFGHPEFPGLSAANIVAACDASLQRLKTDYIDVYYAHHDDPSVDLEETVAAFSGLVDAGKVRVVGASNFSAARLEESVRIAERDGLHRYRISQDHYNLMERGFESRLLPSLTRNGMTEVPYYGLASGFLSGKYRLGAEVDSARGGGPGQKVSGVHKYLDERGLRILGVLDEVAAAHQCEVATVALAWLSIQPAVGAVSASARALHQLPALLAVADLTLSTEEVAALDQVSSMPAPSTD